MFPREMSGNNEFTGDRDDTMSIVRDYRTTAVRPLGSTSRMPGSETDVAKRTRATIFSFTSNKARTGWLRTHTNINSIKRICTAGSVAGLKLGESAISSMYCLIQSKNDLEIEFRPAAV